LIYGTHIPVFPLNEFIDSFIYYKDYHPVHSIDRFLPDANTYIIIDLNDYPKYIYDNITLKEIQACRKAWFSGIRYKYITIPSGRDSEMFIINFRKGRAYPFFKIPMNEFADVVVDAELVLTKEILDVRETMANLPSISNKFKYLETYFLKKLKKNFIENPFINYAVDMIQLEPSKITIEQISNKIGYSQKHLIKLFKEKVGLTPKSFLMVSRFQKAIHLIELCKDRNWTEISHKCGYYDQSHFIDEFKSFSGFTPNQYSNLKYDNINYIPVG